MNVENIAYACVTRFVEEGFGDREALIWVENDLASNRYTYDFFERESNRVSGVLRPGKLM